jgi:hypothetical protein
MVHTPQHTRHTTADCERADVVTNAVTMATTAGSSSHRHTRPRSVSQSLHKAHTMCDSDAASAHTQPHYQSYFASRDAGTWLQRRRVSVTPRDDDDSGGGMSHTDVTHTTRQRHATRTHHALRHDTARRSHMQQRIASRGSVRHSVTAAAHHTPLHTTPYSGATPSQRRRRDTVHSGMCRDVSRGEQRAMRARRAERGSTRQLRSQATHAHTPALPPSTAVNRHDDSGGT